MEAAGKLAGGDVLKLHVGKEAWLGSVISISCTDEAVTALMEWFDGSERRDVRLAGVLRAPFSCAQESTHTHTSPPRTNTALCLLLCIRP